MHSGSTVSIFIVAILLGGWGKGVHLVVQLTTYRRSPKDDLSNQRMDTYTTMLLGLTQEAKYNQS